jgi:hypothetical protein
MLCELSRPHSPYSSPTAQLSLFGSSLPPGFSFIKAGIGNDYDSIEITAGRRNRRYPTRTIACCDILTRARQVTRNEREGERVTERRAWHSQAVSQRPGALLRMRKEVGSLCVAVGTARAFFCRDNVTCCEIFVRRVWNIPSLFWTWSNFSHGRVIRTIDKWVEASLEISHHWYWHFEFFDT